MSFQRKSNNAEFRYEFQRLISRRRNATQRIWLLPRWLRRAQTQPVATAVETVFGEQTKRGLRYSRDESEPPHIVRPEHDPRCSANRRKSSLSLNFVFLGQWPWHAALFHAQGPQLMYTCGATLISETHILTAAHCVAKPQTSRAIDTKRLTVYLGIV